MDRRKTKPTELGLVRKRLTSLRPAPENDELYRPIRADDPAIIELAKAIERDGLLEPPVISSDGDIVSGHRRVAALKLLGKKTVLCRVLEISRQTNPDGFLRLLREHNRQREKTLAEKIREQVVSLNDEDCHRRLRERRAADAMVNVDALQMDEGRPRPAISAAKREMLKAVKQVLVERKKYLPLTVRSVHYALLNNPPLRHAGKPDSIYQNDKASYKSLVDFLARARLTGLIAMEAISDETRPVTQWKVFQDASEFVRIELDRMFRGYYRDLMQSQPNHIEVICEKNTVDGILKMVTSEYGIPQTSGRGYASLPPRAGIAKRYRDSGKEKLVLLLVSDLDPDGEEICYSFARSMRDDFGIEGVVPIKVALTPDQVQQRNLPPTVSAKPSSSNYAKFSAKHGEVAYELEALHPDDLRQILRDAIEAVIDKEAFDYEVAQEKEDAALLEATRRAVVESLRAANVLPEQEDV